METVELNYPAMPRLTRLPKVMDLRLNARLLLGLRFQNGR